jgi:gamma-glutamylcysteine synthetase
MTDVQRLIARHFLEPMDRKPTRHFGTEFEFPIINLRGGSVEEEVALGLMDHMIGAAGCVTKKRDAGGRTIAVENPATGDLIAFEFCLHMLEISLAKSQSLTVTAGQLYCYLDLIQDYLRSRAHALSGFGVHPFARTIDKSPIAITHYRMLSRFMRLREPGNSPFHDLNFFAVINSAQTHLDCSLADAPRVFDVFSRLDWINALLFSNSVAIDGAGRPEADFIGCRDLYYQASALGERKDNIGPFDENFREPGDVCRAVSACSIWYVIDGDNYIFFRPIPLSEFFLKPAIECHLIDAKFEVHRHVLVPEETHIEYFKGFKNVILSKHKTIEIRSSCQQPLAEALAPAAFVVGCMESLSVIEDILRDNEPALSNRDRRQAVVLNRVSGVGSREHVARMVREVVAAAHAGLTRRHKGEEKFLEPTLERAQRLSCPGADALRHLRAGRPVLELIERYAQAGPWRGARDRATVDAGAGA